MFVRILLAASFVLLLSVPVDARMRETGSRPGAQPPAARK